MINVNLTCWREAKRRRQVKQLIVYILVAIALASLITGSLYSYLQINLMVKREELQQYAFQLKSIPHLSSNSSISVAEFNRDKQHYQIVKDTLSQHERVQSLFVILDKLLPAEIFLVELRLDGEQLRLTGISHSNDSLTQFLALFSQLAWFKEPQISFSVKNKINQEQHTIKTKEKNKHFELYALFNHQEKA